jgi:hypothetical protein
VATLALPLALCGAALQKGNKLIDAEGRERKAWEIARGKRAWGEARNLWDTHCRVYRSTRVVALPVRHPEYQGHLWLVVVRQGRGREPWYLLTNEPVETIEQAWEMVFSYASRWKIEESFRFQKGELLIDSVRLRSWQAQHKLLWLVTLAYGALLAMLSPPLWRARCRLLVQCCQRADRRLWRVKVPLYRLRWSERPALAGPSATLGGLASLSAAGSCDLARLFSPLVDDAVAPLWISVLKLCSESWCTGEQSTMKTILLVEDDASIGAFFVQVIS